MGNIEEQHFDTDDFSSSSSSEPNTSSSASDELKSSSNNDASNDDSPPRQELGNAPRAAAGTESKGGNCDHNPLPKRDNHQEESKLGALFDGALLNENTESFPYTLKRMLDVESESNPQAIRWLAAGDGFEGKW